MGINSNFTTSTTLLWRLVIICTVMMGALPIVSSASPDVNGSGGSSLRRHAAAAAAAKDKNHAIRQEIPVPEIYQHAGMNKVLYRQHLPDDDDDDEDDEDRDLQFVSGGTNEYTPIRIHFDTRLLEQRIGEKDETDEEINDILNNILPQASSVWSQHLYVPRRRNGGGRGIPVDADVCGTVYGQALGNEDIVVHGADLVILVGGDFQNYCEGSTLAYAGACALDDATERPLIGIMNFCLGVSKTRTRYIYGDQVSKFFGPWTGANLRENHLQVTTTEIAVHEMAHILGQSDFLFLFFRDENGVPRTPRNQAGFPLPRLGQCGNGTFVENYFPSETTVQVVNVDGNRYEHYLVTPRVSAVAKAHFECPSLPGARLSDNPKYCIGSHWHERHYYTELMSPIVSGSSENHLSAITLALFDDSGWYRVDYRGAQQSPFGRGAGCGFVQEDCIDSRTEEPPSWNQNEFCAAPLLPSRVGIGFEVESLDSVFCDPSHTSWTICDLLQYPEGTSLPVQYFSDPRLAPLFSHADGCPIPDIGIGLDCTIDADYNVFYPGETAGQGSRCINAYYATNNGQQAFQPACMRVVCSEEEGVQIVAKVDGEDIVLTCSFGGEELPVPGKPKSFFICPRLATVCPELYACPDDCSGRGQCIYPADDSSTTARPYCACFDEANTSESCAPEFVLTLPETGTRPIEGEGNQPSTSEPSSKPTIAPTFLHSVSPTTLAMNMTDHPAMMPAMNLTDPPTMMPAMNMTDPPTMMPAMNMTDPPTPAPSNFPTGGHSNAPSLAQSNSPTLSPTMTPTVSPTKSPTVAPTDTPSAAPSRPQEDTPAPSIDVEFIVPTDGTEPPASRPYPSEATRSPLCLRNGIILLCLLLVSFI